METTKIDLPLCVTCSNAWRAPQGYVRACALHLDDATPLQMYGRCVEASVSGKCEDYKQRTSSKQKPS